MLALQIITIVILFCIVVLSVIVGTRAHQKEREATEKKFKQLQLTNRADRIQQHIRSIFPINTDPVATDVLYDFYIDTLRELINFAEDPEHVEMRIAKAEEERNQELVEFTTRPPMLSFQEKANYKERLTKVAKMLLYLRRRGRISHTHYQICYDYLRWLNLWLQLNRQIVQANNNFDGGDLRVAQTLYGVIMSHLKSTSLNRPEKKQTETFIMDQMTAILKPKIMAIQNAESPEEAFTDLVLDLEESSDADLLGEIDPGIPPQNR